MKQKNNSADQGAEGQKTRHKGESQQSHQQGATSISKKGSGKHRKDDSGGAEEQSTKKQANSV